MTKNILFIIGSAVAFVVLSPVVLAGFIFGALKEAFCFGAWLVDILTRRLARREAPKATYQSLEEVQAQLMQFMAKHK